MSIINLNFYNASYLSKKMFNENLGKNVAFQDSAKFWHDIIGTRQKF